MKRRRVKRSRQLEGLSDPSLKQTASRQKRTAPMHGWWRRVWRYGPLIIIFVLTGYLLLFSNIFQIQDIDVQGPNKTLSRDIQKGAEQYLGARLFGRNWLLLSTNELRNNLQKAFGGPESILVEKVFPSRLIIKTDEQAVGMLWKTGSRRYQVSVNGRIVSEMTPEQSSDLPMVVDLSNIPLDVGEQVVSRQFVSFIATINKEMAILKFVPVNFFVRDTTGELIVRTNQGYEIKFDTTTDVNTQLGALRGVLGLLESQNKKPAEYIDLRVPNRAFYR